MRPTTATPARPAARSERGRWSFGPFWGTLCGLGGAIITSQLGRLFGDLVWWVPLGATTAAMAVVAAVWLYRRNDQRTRQPYAGEEITPVRALPYRLGCVAAGGAWATWVAVTGYHPAKLAVLGVGGLALAAFSPLFAPSTPPQPDQAQLAAYLPPPVSPVQVVDPLVAKWVQLLNAVLMVRDGKPGVTVSRIEHWALKTGYTVNGTVPPNSRHTYRTIGEEAAGIASSLQLPSGCPVKVEQGEHQGAFRIKVSTVNDLDKVISYPGPLRRRSAEDDFPIGRHRDGADAVIDFHQSSSVVVGMRGSGKTGILQVYTATAAQCVDVLVWHVDLNGGSISAPWVASWARGECDRPAVDWAATTAEEAIRMATVGLAIAKDRKSRFQAKLLNEDTDVLPLSPETPGILIIVDEGAEMFGEDATPEGQRAAGMLRELQRIGRAMCVNVIFSVMRGTSDCVPAQMKKLTLVKVVMGVDDDSEIAYVLDWSKGLRADDLTSPGSGFLRRGKLPPEMFKGYRLSPQDIRRIAIEVSAWRPQLDAAGRMIGGKVYAERWERDAAVRWLDALAGRAVVLDDEAPGVAVDAEEVEAAVKGSVSPLAMAAAFDQFADMFDNRLAEQAEQPPSDAEPSPDLTAPPIVDTVGGMTDDEDQDQADQSGYDLVVKWVRDAGDAGIKREQLVALATEAGVTRRPSTVSNWLKRGAEEGLVGSKGGQDWAMWVWVGHDPAQEQTQAATAAG